MIAILILLSALSAQASAADVELADEGLYSFNLIVKLYEGEENAAENMYRLTQALSYATQGYRLNIVIEKPGEYYISSAGPALRLRSCTTLDLNGSTLIRWGDMHNIMQNADLNGDNSAGSGYSLAHDITVKNGTLDGRGGTGEVVNLCNFGHAERITMSNLTLKNNKSHLIEFTGCRGCVVSDCVFTGYTGSENSAVEAVQFDICDNRVAGSWNGVYFSDGTPCRDMRVENCRFADYPSGVGNHKGIAGDHNSNISVSECVFENTLYSTQPAVSAFDFDDSAITGNTISGVYGCGIRVNAGKNIAVSNNTISLSGTGILVTSANSLTSGERYVVTPENAEAMKINSNTITSTGSGIGFSAASGSAVAEFCSNTVTSASSPAVKISASTVTRMKSNKLKSASAQGLMAASESLISEISGNSVNAYDHGIQVSSNSRVKKIANNSTIKSKKANGIHVTAATADVISGNTVKNCGGCGIMLTSTGKAGSIISNKASSCKEYGIRVNNTKITLIYEKNSCVDNGLGGSLISAKLMLATPVLTSAKNSYSGVELKWGSVSGAAKYRVFRKSGSSGWVKLADTTALKYVDKNVSTCVSYTYTVRCLASDSLSYTSSYDPEGKTVYYLAAPKITAFSNTAAGTKISWSAVGGAYKYRVLIYDGEAWVKLADTSGTSYTHNSLNGGTTYTYSVQSLDGSLKSGYNTAGWSNTFILPPAAPKLSATKTYVNISWSKCAGAVKYRVFRKTGSSGWVKLADTTGLGYTDRSAVSGKTYTYTVRCVNSAGTAYTSAYNKTGSTITVPR